MTTRRRSRVERDRENVCVCVRVWRVERERDRDLATTTILPRPASLQLYYLPVTLFTHTNAAHGIVAVLALVWWDCVSRRCQNQHMLWRVTWWWYQPNGGAPRGPIPQTPHPYRSDTHTPLPSLRYCQYCRYSSCSLLLQDLLQNCARGGTRRSTRYFNTGCACLPWDP
jgi:hypothetical protein